MKQTICLDFDGVIHQYISPWTSATDIPDPPVEGAREAIQALREKYEVVVLSSRAGFLGGVPAMNTWLRKYDIEIDHIADTSEGKPPAKLYVDDRGFTFTGNWNEVLRAADNFVPWNKQEDDWGKGSFMKDNINED